MHDPGLKQAARACLRDAKTDPRKVALAYLLIVAFLDIGYSLVSTLLETGLEQTTGLSALSAAGLLRNRNIWYAAAPILLWVLGTLLSAGYVSWSLGVSRGRDVGYGALLDGFRSCGRVLWLTVLESLLIMLWSMLFVIPGIVAAYRYRMAMWILMNDPGVTAMEAINESKRITAGHKLELFILDVSFWWYYLLLFAVSMAGSVESIAAYLTELGLMSGTLSLSLWQSFGLGSLCEVLTLVIQLCCLPYVQTTYAHAFHYLKQLGDDRYLGTRA